MCSLVVFFIKLEFVGSFSRAYFSDGSKNIFIAKVK